MQLLAEDVQQIAFIDKLNRLEKLGALRSAVEWLDLRELRNSLARENVFFDLTALLTKLDRHGAGAMHGCITVPAAHGHWPPLGRSRAIVGWRAAASCWWGRDATIRRLSSIEGLDNLRVAADRGKGIILLSAHFTSLELGVRIGQLYLREFGIETTAM